MALLGRGTKGRWFASAKNISCFRSEVPKLFALRTFFAVVLLCGPQKDVTIALSLVSFTIRILVSAESALSSTPAEGFSKKKGQVNAFIAATFVSLAVQFIVRLE